MAVPVVVQTPNVVLAATVSSVQITLPSVTPGNSLIGCVVNPSSAVRSWDVTDDRDAGSWGTAILFQPNASMQILYRHNVTGGTTVATFTINTGTWSGHIFACEVSGLDTVATPVTGSLLEVSNSDDHNCAGSNVAASDAFVICVGSLNSAATSTVAGSTYTLTPGLASSNQMSQYKAVSTQNDTGPWHSTGTDRTGRSCMAAFPAPASGGGGNPWYAYAQQRVTTIQRSWQRSGLLWTPSYA